MARGKWAQGIKPRQFHWIIQDQLALCERPGGYGVNHRRVRRQEEVIWIRENGFAFVISMIPSGHNLHSYDELGMPWKHWPFAPSLNLETALPQIYTELVNLLGSGKKILIHMEEVSDRMAGFVAGYLRWTEMVPVTFEAIMVVERILGRQMGPTGRGIVTAAEEALANPPPIAEAGDKSETTDSTSVGPAAADSTAAESMTTESAATESTTTGPAAESTTGA